jgi:hypothetical protein
MEYCTSSLAIAPCARVAIRPPLSSGLRETGSSVTYLFWFFLQILHRFLITPEHLLVML